MTDRRGFSFGLLAMLTAACGSRASGHATAPSDPWWSTWRARFLRPDGRVVDTGNNGISHSEGQGYGMLFAVHADDRDAFTRMAAWTETHLARSDVALFSWRYDPSATAPVSDPNNASDGDILIAWALALAGAKWNETKYLARSTQIRAALLGRCVIERHGLKVIVPGMAGFAEGTQVVLNPSYYIWPALNRFAKIDGAQAWGRVIADGLTLLEQARFGSNRLPTDWVALCAPGKLVPAPGRDPRFGYDAVRVPLYAMMGELPSLAAPVAKFWRECLATDKPIPAWIDVETGQIANYPISSGGAAIAARLLGLTEPEWLADDYYAASLQMLARI